MPPITPHQRWQEDGGGRGRLRKVASQQMLPSLVLPELLENPFSYLPPASFLPLLISGSHQRQERIINTAVGYKTQFS